jgi:hypothetical protein
MWELYNYTTFAMKESHPANWMDSHIKAHRFFVGESSLYVSSSKAESIMAMSGDTEEEIEQFRQLSIF